MPPLSNDPAKLISPTRYGLFKIVSVASTSLAVALGGLAATANRMATSSDFEME
jgi:hypothetical protein